ncbi:MAG TPA: rod shape-determining protein MreD [Crenotrichaceae bacterium]|nr:rod shape-determining protein MreD [Crenotrichaceae bacterium]
MSLIKIILYFIVAMMLRIAPIPPAFFPFNPDWILLIIIALALIIPSKFSIGSAWLVGLLTDVLTTKLLGQHALAYAVCAYIVAVLYRQVRHYAVIQQCFLVFSLLLLSRVVIYITTSVQGMPRADWSYWSPTIIGAMIWPLVYRLLRKSSDK